jgi:hypothetical protein
VIVTGPEVLLVLVLEAMASLAGPPARTLASCVEATIGFHTATLERLVSDPAGVLADEDGFWESEPPQRYTRMWAEGTGIDIPYGEWREQVAALSRLSDVERRTHPLTRMAREIADGGEEFLARAVPHICAYLPDGANLDIGIHFTAYVPPRSFVAGEVVINVSADYWQGDVEHILNSIVHELFHVGYSKARAQRTEPPLNDERLYGMLDALHNEGMATYVGYEAQSLFPAPGERDYPMLDDPSAVRRLRALLNDLFAQVDGARPEQIDRWSWARGVTMRGYYVVGAHMARTIERERGREALIGTIAQGPVAFVRAYNALVSSDERIVVPGVTDGS